MSSSDSFSVSYTTLAVLAAGLAGGYAITKLANSPSPAPTVPSSSPSDLAQAAQQKAKKPNKKKKTAAQQVTDHAQPLVDRAGDLKDHAVAAATSALNTAKEQPVVQRAVETVSEAVSAAQDAVAQQTGGSAGKKKKKGKKTSPSASPAPGASSAAPSGSTAVAPAPAAAAEAHAARTAPSFDAAVEDMRDEGVDPQPQVARTMKIVGGKAGADPKSLLKVPGQESDEGWERADAFEDDEGGWESVVAKKPSRPTTPSGSSSASAAAPQRVVPGMATAPLTKKQRENAAKKDKADAAKAEKEREQEERLKAYRREQEKAKIAADNAARARARPRSQNFFGSEPVQPQGKTLGGGMHASLDPTSGSLVWD
ncbi:hypothetical protein JCM10213_000975 [Rhodosporidiobolus nylandii]